MKISFTAGFLIFLNFAVTTLNAQDLDPRAYVRIPVDIVFFTTGLVYTAGSVVSDPAAPIQDLQAEVGAPIIGTGFTKDLFGFTSQFFASIPFMWAHAEGKVLGEERTTNRSGLGDMRMRLSVLLYGAPAISIEEFKKEAPSLIVGTSLTVIAPTGQYFSEKLINLGTNRWSFKPEAGISYRVSRQWLMDVYAGVWIFTNNNNFYPGNNLRKQDPLFAFQGHLSYNITPATWAAINLTYYTGGQSSVNDIYKDDRQNNTRIGATLNFPISKVSAIRVAYSRGAIVRIGSNFSTISASWQILFW